MVNYMQNIINKLKKDTNNQDHIIYRKKRMLYKSIYIIYNETLISSDTISDFIIRSLNQIKIPTKTNITNKISNFKYKYIYTYEDICYYLNSGFTIFLLNNKTYIALETRRDLSRGVSVPTTENATRGPLDSFTENIETNIGLIKRRIKSNDLWIKPYKIGKYTDTSISLLYINSIIKPELVKKIDKILKRINIDGIISSGVIRNLIDVENKNIFPNIISTEKPHTAVKYLLEGHIIILVDNDPFVLVMPVSINDYFLSGDDEYNRSYNITFTRIVRYITFAITILTPGIYIAVTTYNQEILPTPLLIGIAAQRENVPFSTFVEALIMSLSFEILRESDLKNPSFASSALSIVGALILGEAAVSAGIVSPIMIIVIAITSISSLTFVEPEFINALRFYRLLFMIGATILGVHGMLLVLIYMLINLSSYELLNLPYLSPFSPTIYAKLKDSIIKLPTIKQRKRNPRLTNNLTKNTTEDNYE